MSLKQYRAFVQTVERRSVSAAAEALGVSQSALTQNLNALEKQFGFPLLVRNRGGVHPAGRGAGSGRRCSRWSRRTTPSSRPCRRSGSGANG